MPAEKPQGDLAKVVTHEPNSEWPDEIEISANWHTKNGKIDRISVRISGDDFFGHKTGAPLSGDHLISIIERLRKRANG
jgi:hypothetical protein